jgi:putative flippase GtrA
LIDRRDASVTGPAPVEQADTLGLSAGSAVPLSWSSKVVRACGAIFGSQPLRYLVVGGWNTLFGYVSFASLYYIFSPVIHYLLIMVMSTVINITNAYLFYKFLVFRTRGDYLREYLRFYAVYAVPIASSFILFPLAIEVMGMNPYLAQAGIVGLTIVVSYLGHKHISFRADAGPLP